MKYDLLDMRTSDDAAAMLPVLLNSEAHAYPNGSTGVRFGDDLEVRYRAKGEGRVIGIVDDRDPDHDDADQQRLALELVDFLAQNTTWDIKLVAEDDSIIRHVPGRTRT